MSDDLGHRRSGYPRPVRWVGVGAPKTAVFSCRMSEDDFDEIRRLAREAGLSQADFVVAKCLGSVGEDVSRVRVVEVEAQVEEDPVRFDTVVVEGVESLPGDRLLVRCEGGGTVEIEASGRGRDAWLATPRGTVVDLMR